MAENTKTTTNTTRKTTPLEADSIQSNVETITSNQYVLQDFRTSILIVSVVINLIVLTTWIALRVTASYDTQMVSLFLTAN